MHCLNLRGLALPIALLFVGELLLRTQHVQSDVLARPSDILHALWAAGLDGSLWTATRQTLAAASGGLLVGGSAGALTGLWFGLSRRAEAAASLSVQLLQPIPSVAMIPIAMLVFGFGFGLEIAVVALTCYWPMLLLTSAAIRQVEPRLLEVSRVLGFPPLQRMTKIVLPAALPRMFVALRLSIGIALVVAVTVEIAANPQGLGYALMSAQQNLRPDFMFAFLLWLGLLGWALSAGLLWLQQHWFAHSLTEAAA